MLMGEVRDAYPTVAADVDLLRQEGGLWALPHHDGNDLVLYPREDPPVITVSPDVAALWHEVEVTLLNPFPRSASGQVLNCQLRTCNFW